MSTFAKPDINGIPEIDNFRRNPRNIDSAVKETFLKYRQQQGVTDSAVTLRLNAIIQHLTKTCEEKTTPAPTVTACAHMLKFYNNFLKKYTNGEVFGGRRNTTKERKQKHNKSHRSRKLKSRKLKR
jgi:hypothetical protein